MIMGNVTFVTEKTCFQLYIYIYIFLSFLNGVEKCKNR